MRLTGGVGGGGGGGGGGESRPSTKLGRKILQYVSDHCKRGATISVTRKGGGGGGNLKTCFENAGEVSPTYFYQSINQRA